MSDQTISSVGTLNSSNSSKSLLQPDLAATSSVCARRKIGRWYLSETLGKGGYSWVKKGYDRKTGQVVALKFMDKRKVSKSWQEAQNRQVRTEIESLKNFQHPNIMRLLAYNLNARYPESSGDDRRVILLVLEYMPRGELFDILYYSSQLEEIVARTYFRQLIEGIEACHSHGICHRDIKPQNLLLNEHYQLKITDFGLAKIFDQEQTQHIEEQKMQSYHVGTRGYQAPEILDQRPYDASCDIFSAGVVLFILLAGYPPFEHAKLSDKWYIPLVNDSPKKFWRNHRGCGVSSSAKDLITRMFQYNPQQRITLQQIKNHKWYQDTTLPMEKLAEALHLRHRVMEIKRKNDPKKQNILVGSYDIRQNQSRPVIDKFEELKNEFTQAPIISNNEIGLNSMYTKSHGIDVICKLKKIIEGVMKGFCEIDWNKNPFSMNAYIRTTKERISNCEIKMNIRVYYTEKLDCNVVTFSRLEGTIFMFHEILRKLTATAKDSALSGIDDSLLELTSEEHNLVDLIFDNIDVAYEKATYPRLQ